MISVIIKASSSVQTVQLEDRRFRLLLLSKETWENQQWRSDVNGLTIVTADGQPWIIISTLVLHLFLSLRKRPHLLVQLADRRFGHLQLSKDKKQTVNYKRTANQPGVQNSMHGAVHDPYPTSESGIQRAFSPVMVSKWLAYQFIMFNFTVQTSTNALQITTDHRIYCQEDVQPDGLENKLTH